MFLNCLFFSTIERHFNSYIENYCDVEKLLWFSFPNTYEFFCNKHSFLVIFWFSSDFTWKTRLGVYDEKDGLDGIPVTCWFLSIEINYYKKNSFFSIYLVSTNDITFLQNLHTWLTVFGRYWLVLLNIYEMAYCINIIESAKRSTAKAFLLFFTWS
jgi:hypothetical protein